MSSLVIGHKNSSGTAAGMVSTVVLSSSIFWRTLLRRPRDSEKPMAHGVTTQPECVRHRGQVWHPQAALSQQPQLRAATPPNTKLRRPPRPPGHAPGSHTVRSLTVSLPHSTTPVCLTSSCASCKKRPGTAHHDS